MNTDNIRTFIMDEIADSVDLNSRQKKATAVLLDVVLQFAEIPNTLNRIADVLERLELTMKNKP